MENETDREFARLGGILPVGHEQYDYDGDINSQPVAPLMNISAVVRAFYASMLQLGRITADQAEMLTQSSDSILN